MKELEMVSAMINYANEYEKETGDKNPTVYFSKSNLLIVEKSLKALEIIKKTKNIKVSFYENGSGKHYKIEFDKTRNQTITEEEFNLLKEVLE